MQHASAAKALERLHICCKFLRGLFAVNFSEDFIFAKFAKFCENKNLAKWQNLLFIDIGKPCLSLEFLTSLICLLMLFTKKKEKYSRKFPNQFYLNPCCFNTDVISTKVSHTVSYALF